jgi:hypothetical protein
MVSEVRPRILRPRRWLGLLAWLLGSIIPSAAQEAGPSEYQVKAAFLFNFAKFITWPSTAFPSPEAPILIGLLGDDPFAGDLTRVIANQRVQGRSFSIVRGTTPASVAHCHLVFFGPAETARLKSLLATLGAMRRPIVTIGEHPDFIAAGGMIRFVVENKKVRFEIEPDAATNAGVVVSSKLLSLAIKPARSRNEAAPL